jgi:hypothetical protein
MVDFHSLDCTSFHGRMEVYGYVSRDHLGKDHCVRTASGVFRGCPWGSLCLPMIRSGIIGVLVDNLDKNIALENIDIGCHNTNSSPFVHEFGRVGSTSNGKLYSCVGRNGKGLFGVYSTA